MDEGSQTLKEIEKRLIAFFESHVGQSVATETLADVIYEGREKPKHWRNATLARVRNLKFKTDYTGSVTIERTTRLGPGAPAIFKIIRRYQK